MIRKLFSVVFLLCLGGAATYYGLGHHFVRTEEGVVVVSKAALEVADTYADIREWTSGDFADHPKLAKALIDGGQADLVAEGAGGELLDAIKDAAEQIMGREQ